MQSKTQVFFFQRNFDRYWDKDKNGLLTEDEISRIFHERTFLNSACIVGLIRSCDTDRIPGINRQEWYTCFKTEGIGHIPFNSLSWRCSPKQLYAVEYAAAIINNEMPQKTL